MKNKDTELKAKAEITNVIALIDKDIASVNAKKHHASSKDIAQFAEKSCDNIIENRLPDARVTGRIEQQINDNYNRLAGDDYTWVLDDLKEYIECEYDDLVLAFAKEIERDFKTK